MTGVPESGSMGGDDLQSMQWESGRAGGWSSGKAEMTAAGVGGRTVWRRGGDGGGRSESLGKRARMGECRGGDASKGYWESRWMASASTPRRMPYSWEDRGREEQGRPMKCCWPQLEHPGWLVVWMWAFQS